MADDIMEFKDKNSRRWIDSQDDLIDDCWNSAVKWVKEELIKGNKRMQLMENEDMPLMDIIRLSTIIRIYGAKRILEFVNKTIENGGPPEIIIKGNNHESI